ncbi:MAG TPA: M56 family metallopeptidase [Puia sp.]|jgi:hypothetical protein|nr:M56 family metallopeptidase [Puia sp.]
MIPYILHVTVITTICFLFYKLLLQKETFYRLNRWMLMGCLAVSFGLPLLPVPREYSWRDKWVERADPPPSTEVRTVNDVKPSIGNGADDAVRRGAPGVLVGVQDKRAGMAKAKRLRAVHDQGTAATKTAANEPGTVAMQPVRVSGVGDPGKDATVTMQVGSAPDPGMKVTPVGATVGASAAHDSRPDVRTVLLLVLQWLFYGYLFGLLLFGGNFFLQIAVLLYQSYSRPVIRDGRFRIVEVRGNRAPCSFGNTIFINPENYDWETYNQILIHEKIHVSGRHTLDILLAEIAVVLQWFNPFVWLYRREVENNLEFLTDASVLQHQEVERSAYQLSLLRVSAPHLPFSITNNYNQSLLKKRIVMMNSKRSSSHTVWKYFFLIPVLSLLVCALNKPAALAAAGRSSTAGHTPAGADPGGNSARPVSPVKFRGLLATVVSVFSDTTIQPATGAGRASSEGASSGKGTSSGGSTSAEDTDEPVKAYNRARAAAMAEADAYYGLSAGMEGLPMDLRQQEKLAARMQEGLVIDNKQLIKLQGAMDVKLKLQPRIDVDVDVDLSQWHNAADTDLREGAWFATSSGDKLSFELKAEDEDHSWSSSLHVEKNEINPFPGQGNVEFKLVREAGTMTFKGQFDGEEGFGHFRFTPDAAYFSALKQMGVEDMDGRREFAYFTVNIKKDYVNMVMHNGYPHISQRDLISLAAMKIDQDFIQYWHGTGLADADNPRNLISLKAMKVDRAYVEDLKAAGYDHLTIHELISLKSQSIDKAYIRSLGRNNDNSPIPVHELVSYKAMHIDSGYLDGLRKAGYVNLPRNEITSLYAMHVSPEYIKGLQDLGYKDIPVRELTSLKAMDVTPEYIKSFRDIGYKDLDVRQLTNFKAMHITPEYVKGFTDIGYKDIDTRQLNSFKAMNITPEFIKGFRDLGYVDLSPNELSSLKAMNVTPDFVKEFNKIGFDHIPVRVLTSLKATGVTADYVSKMKEKGFVSKDLSKYIRLKNDFE